MIQTLSGRWQDFLRTPDGNQVPAIFFPVSFRELKGIDQYQVIQNTLDSITLKIVRNRFYSEAETESMVRTIRNAICPSVSVSVETCDQIPLTRLGKSRLVISHVADDVGPAIPTSATK